MTDHTVPHGPSAVSGATTMEGPAFDEHAVLERLRHYLPSQAPLKDFIHHNTLHAFQHERFTEALHRASRMFGYKTTFTVNEYRKLHREGRIQGEVLQRVVRERKGEDQAASWMTRMLGKPYDGSVDARIGRLRAHWKRDRRIDMDAIVHTNLFRVLNSYLDQGIAIWRFPVWDKGFLASVRELHRHALTGLIRGDRARELLFDEACGLRDLLAILVSEEALFEQYLFDQQFAHPGWSGLVAVIEGDPGSLLDRRNITLREVIMFELLLEIDALDREFPKGWRPLSENLRHRPTPLFAPVPFSEVDDVRSLWQEAYEWSYYDEVLAGLREVAVRERAGGASAVQGLFCIDDRECSLRRHLERLHPGFHTYGTPGHFGVEFYYRPEHGRFNTKVCPAPVTPRYLIKEVDKRQRRKRDAHFGKHSHGLVGGWIVSQTLGFWSALRLFVNIFKPTATPGTSDAFQHMDHLATLTVENVDPDHREDGLQVGFTVPEMGSRVEAVLRSIGLVKDFAPLVYVVGHGASSVNNPHYAAYDCGACSGRPGSVNARVFCQMANHAAVRELLNERGITIPAGTRFVAGLHDTTRDEVVFYDELALTDEQRVLHGRLVNVFGHALDANARERARRFDTIDTEAPEERVHDLVKLRSVSLFEPRPELNHATNALCVVGRRELTRGLFLDRRSFLNSYDPSGDPDGRYLTTILGAAAPVTGGINLEYFFSRMDNQKLGAGTKLPHNVMGLVGVANGIEGDLRTGLPSQMIEVHDPVRLLMIVEQEPTVVLDVIKRIKSTYEWFDHEWIHLVAIRPGTDELYRFREGRFEAYLPQHGPVARAKDVLSIKGGSMENLPVTLLMHH